MKYWFPYIELHNQQEFGLVANIMLSDLMQSSDDVNEG